MNVQAYVAGWFGASSNELKWVIAIRGFSGQFGKFLKVFISIVSEKLLGGTLGFRLLFIFEGMGFLYFSFSEMSHSNNKHTYILFYFGLFLFLNLK